MRENLAIWKRDRGFLQAINLCGSYLAVRVSPIAGKSVDFSGLNKYYFQESIVLEIEPDYFFDKYYIIQDI